MPLTPRELLERFCEMDAGELELLALVNRALVADPTRHAMFALEVARASSLLLFPEVTPSPRDALLAHALLVLDPASSSSESTMLAWDAWEVGIWAWEGAAITHRAPRSAELILSLWHEALGLLAVLEATPGALQVFLTLAREDPDTPLAALLATACAALAEL